MGQKKARSLHEKEKDEEGWRGREEEGSHFMIEAPFCCPSRLRSRRPAAQYGMQQGATVERAGAQGARPLKRTS